MRLALLALLLFAGTGFAEDRPCSADAAARCPKAGDWAQRARCLEAHEDKLTPACRAHLAEMRSRGDQFRAACGADIARACPAAQGRALVECLEAQGETLSKTCAGRVASMRGPKKAERIPAGCKDDAQRLCAGVAPGGLEACLRQNLGKVDKECREALQ